MSARDEGRQRKTLDGRRATRSAASGVLVVADLVADEFVYGRVQRVSREAPGAHPPVRRRRTCAWAAARTPSTTSAPWAARRSRWASWAATSTGAACARSCASGASPPRRSRPIPTTSRRSRRRILAGGVPLDQAADRAHRQGHAPRRLAAPRARAWRRALRRFRGPLDAVLVSDYGFGLVTPELVRGGRRPRAPPPECPSPSTRATACSPSAA